MSTSDKDLDYIFKIIFLGDSFVGKTNIVLKFYSNTFSSNSKSTVGVEFYAKVMHHDNKNIKVQLWDTAGQERFKSITSSYFKGAKGAFIVYDITRRETFESVPTWYRDIKNLSDNKNIAVTLIGNKSDLQAERKVTEEEGRKAAEMNNMAFIETSAKDGTNIITVFESMVKAICDKRVSLGDYGLRDERTQKVEEEEIGKKMLDVNTIEVNDNKKKGCC